MNLWSINPLIMVHITGNRSQHINHPRSSSRTSTENSISLMMNLLASTTHPTLAEHLAHLSIKALGKVHNLSCSKKCIRKRRTLAARPHTDLNRLNLKCTLMSIMVKYQYITSKMQLRLNLRPERNSGRHRHSNSNLHSLNNINKHLHSSRDNHRPSLKHRPESSRLHIPNNPLQWTTLSHRF